MILPQIGDVLGQF